MAGELGQSVVEVRWIANPWRGDRFEELWAPVAEAALDYGATAFAFLRSKEDQAVFMQLAFGFESKLDWERYWLSEEVSDARARATGLFQVPVYPEWQQLVGFGSRALAPVME
jgi:hypothetical protein